MTFVHLNVLRLEAAQVPFAHVLILELSKDQLLEVLCDVTAVFDVVGELCITPLPFAGGVDQLPSCGRRFALLLVFTIGKCIPDVLVT